MLGASTPRRDGPREGHRPGAYVDDMTLPGMLHRRDRPEPVAARPDPRHRLRSRDSLERDSPSSRRRTSPAATASRSSSTTSPASPTIVVNHPRGTGRCCSRTPIAQLLEKARRHVRIDIARRAAGLHHRRCARRARDRVGAATTSSSATSCRAATSTRRSARGPVIVEGEYETGAQEQLYIEPNGMIAVASPDARRHGVGLDAVPVLHPQGADARSSICRPTKVRVVQMETGGGFGGKEEYPSIDRRRMPRCWRGSPAGRSSWSTTAPRTWSRRPSGIRRGRGIGPRCRRDGRLLGMEIDFVIDGGAYCTLSPVVLSRGTIHAAGPVLLPERAHQRPRRRDQHAAARRVSRLRRAAEHVRARAPHGSRRGRRRSDARTSCAAAISSAPGRRAPSAR